MQAATPDLVKTSEADAMADVFKVQEGLTGDDTTLGMTQGMKVMLNIPKHVFLIISPCHVCTILKH